LLAPKIGQSTKPAERVLSDDEVGSGTSQKARKIAGRTAIKVAIYLFENDFIFRD
tara:strand:- start:480 stop:644 length:165 start_codon:yes stop_codon:yes gene_type:complete